MKKIVVILLGLTVLASSSEAIVVSCGEDKVEVNAPGLEKYSLTVYDAMETNLSYTDDIGNIHSNLDGPFPLKQISADQLRWVVQLADAIFTDLDSLSEDRVTRESQAQELLAENKARLSQIYQNRALLEMVSDYKTVRFLDIPELEAAIADYITDKIVDNDFIKNQFAQNSQQWQTFRAQVDPYMSYDIGEKIKNKYPEAFLYWDLHKTLEGHTDLVRLAMFSPDGNMIVTASWDSTAKIWDANTGNLVHTLQGDNRPLHSAMFSPDGSKIVTAPYGNTAEIWDAKTGVLIRTLVGHEDSLASAMFSSDGSRIVTASSDNTAKIWNANTGDLVHTLVGHTDWVFSAMFSPDDSKIVTASKDRTAKIWDADTGELLYTLEGHIDSVRSAMFSSDGSRIVTASNDKTAKIWGANTGNLLHTLEDHDRWVNSVLFSLDGSRIVTASGDGTAKIWDTKTGDLVHNLEGHTDFVFSAMFSTDGSKIVTASKDRTAKIWNANTGRLLHALKIHTDSVRSAMFSPDGSKIVTASDDNTAKIWRTHHQFKYATLDIILMSILLSRLKEQNKVLDLLKMNTKHDQSYLLSIFNKLSDNNKSFFTTAYENTLYVPNVSNTYNLKSYIKYLPLLGAATIGGYLLYKMLHPLQGKD